MVKETFDLFAYICKVPAGNIGVADFVEHVMQFDFAAHHGRQTRHKLRHPQIIIALNDSIYVTIF
jgi:hypothetical protein